MLAVTACSINPPVSASRREVFSPSDDPPPVDTAMWNTSSNKATVRATGS